MRHLLAIAVLGTLLMFVSAATVHAGEDLWLLVDSERGIAELRNGDGTVTTFPGLAHGRGGVSDLHLRGDHTTPRGEYRVTHINRESDFHIFVGLNYPTMSHVDEAHRRGLISDREYGRMLDYALANGQMPPDSVLGGHIGFHGVGEADPVLHKRLNWTQGCIAMTDRQVRTLTRLISVGTRVVIR